MSTLNIGLDSATSEQRVVRCEDGTELSYWMTGSAGPWVICVNAHGQDLLIFRGLVRELSNRHRVIAWKPRGTYEDRAAPHTLWDQVADLTRILRQENITECLLITWCAGAKVAIELARKEPAVRSMVLTNGTFTRIPGLERFETVFERTLADLCRTVAGKPALAGMMMSAMRSLLDGAARTSSTLSDSTAGRQSEALNALIAEPFQTLQTTRRYAEQVVDYLAHDVSPSLRGLQIPVLVLSGEHDRVSSPEMARAVAEMLPKGSVAQIASGSHYCLYEEPEEAADRIERFLASAT